MSIADQYSMINVSDSNKNKAIWIDYDGNTDVNYKAAIQYYNTRINTFLTAMLAKLKANTNSMQSMTTEELFNQMQSSLDPFISNWEIFYNTRPDVKKLQSVAQQYIQAVQQEELKYAETAARAKLLIDLMRTEGIMNDSMVNTLPATLDFATVETDLMSMTQTNDIHQLIGHRTNIMSEIFEQGGRHFSGVIGDQINNMIAGTGRILNSSGKQIKPDAILTMSTSLAGQLPSATSTRDLSISVDLEEIIDLERYANNPDALLAAIGIPYSDTIGITMKMWTNKARHKTMGYMSLSASDLERSKIHSDAGTKRLYNAYVHSKYLINIIGAANGLILGGSKGLERTDSFLENLLNSRRGIMASKDDLSSSNALEIMQRYRREVKRQMRAKNG